MNADLILYNIGQLVTSRELPNGEIEILEDGYIAIKDGKIFAVGSGDIPKELISFKTSLKDARKCVVTPGLIDCHTHLVHFGSRENELTHKIEGKSYLEILKKKEGISKTVRETSEATVRQLVEKAKKTLDKMLFFGITTVESKSGYGLTLKNERKQLEVNKILSSHHPVDIVSTFMGAHAIPEDYLENREEFIKEIIEMLPKIKEENLAEFCDIYFEKGIFTMEESKKILLTAKEFGFKLKLHTDIMNDQEGAKLAAEVGAISTSHLIYSNDEGIKALAGSGTVAVLLPGVSFNIGEPYAQARKFIEHGVQVALSTDYNPGSCPTENLQLIMQLAASQMKMNPNQIFKAVTINAAKAIGRQDIVGSIEVGKKADIVVFDAPNIDYILYHFGTNHAKYVYKNGSLIVNKRHLYY